MDSSDFPAVYKWIESLPPLDEHHDGEKVDADTATDLLFKEQYASPEIGFDEKDSVDVAKGEAVRVETNDEYVIGLLVVRKRWKTMLTCL